MTDSAPTPIPVDTLLARIRAEVARRRQALHKSSLEEQASEQGHAAAPVSLYPLPLPQLPKPRFVTASRFRLNDFLALHDEDFIEAVYKGVLKRPTDETGRAHFLTCVRNGSLSKVEVLGRLRYSPEGRRQKVPVRGLLPAFVFQHAYRIPVLGSLLAFAIALVRLPRLARTLQGLEGYQHQRNNEIEAAIKNLALAAGGNERALSAAIADAAVRNHAVASNVDVRMESLDESISKYEGHVEELSAVIIEQTHQSDSRLAQVDHWQREVMAAQASTSAKLDEVAVVASTTVLDLGNRLEEVESGHQRHESRLMAVESLKQTIDQQLLDAISLSQQTSAQLAATLHDAFGTLEQRIEGLGTAVQAGHDQAQNSRLRMVERVARLEGRVHEQGLRGAQITLASAVPLDVSESDPALRESRFDRLYVAFEQRFRGTREDIRQRLSYYLPLLRESAVGSDGATVLDIGCGRGEWLELLRDENIAARGVDNHIGMAQACVERGLDVHCGDAIDYLKQLPDNALGAISGFHIIEHISLELFLELIEQAYRVVQPGGLVIFETPNPENVVVGACNFYIDPTHQRPLPPVLSQFLVESGGFVDVAIHRVNANLLPQFFDEPDENDPPALRTALTYLRSVFQSAPDYSVVGRVA